MNNAQIGLVGLAVMGANLARNIASRDIPVVVYNRTTETMESFIEAHGNAFLFGEKELADFVARIERPRKIILMVKAGPAVDKVIESLLPHLDKGDLIIDCGNSNFRDSERRFNDLKEKGFQFMGCGVSGGEEGALKGPSIMPGGTKESWEMMKSTFEAIAARDFDGGPCVTYVGEGASGHYVKMAHNGIEYGVMQMMAEGYELLRLLYGLEAPQIAEIFNRYNNGRLQSFLFEISVDVLKRKDEFNEGYLIDYILDKAGQKGTGKWTGIDALDRGIGLSTIAEAVFARTISARKDKRVQLSKLYDAPERETERPLDEFIMLLEGALYAGMLCSYAQGYDLIENAAQEEGWHLNMGEISRIWEGGCIIRAQILKTLHAAFSDAPAGTHLFEIPSMVQELKSSIPPLRRICSYAQTHGVAIPSLSTALAYFDAMTSARVPANMIQGLRDNFGAHTYERTDREGVFHTEWLDA